MGKPKSLDQIKKYKPGKRPKKVVESSTENGASEPDTKEVEEVGCKLNKYYHMKVFN